MRRVLISSIFILGMTLSLFAEKPREYKVTAPPEGKYDEFYKKYVSAQGFPIVASEKVSDYALLEAAYLIDIMLDGRDDIRKAIIDSGTRFAIMSEDELTTNIPEHSDLKPKIFWDRRARGLGRPEDVQPSVVVKKICSVIPATPTIRKTFSSMSLLM